MCTAGSAHHVIGSHPLLGIADHSVGLRSPVCVSPYPTVPMGPKHTSQTAILITASDSGFDSAPDPKPCASRGVEASFNNNMNDSTLASIPVLS